ADVAIGATMELGRSWRTLLLMMLLLRPRGAGEVPGHRQQAARSRAAWAALRLLADVAIGATMELGRSWRTLLLMMLLLRPRGAGEVPGHRQQAALKDQRFRLRHRVAFRVS